MLTLDDYREGLYQEEASEVRMYVVLTENATLGTELTLHL